MKSILVRVDQTNVAQDHQLLRDIGLTSAQHGLQVAHILVTVPQDVQDLQPHRVRQRLEKPCSPRVSFRSHVFDIPNVEYSVTRIEVSERVSHVTASRDDCHTALSTSVFR